MHSVSVILYQINQNMQTRKSGNTKDSNIANSSITNSSLSWPNQWQSTTLGAISRQQRSGLTSGGLKALKGEVKPSFNQSQSSLNVNSQQSVSQPDIPAITSAQTRNKLALGQGSPNIMYQIDSRSPVPNKTKSTIMSSAVKRASDTLSANKLHHPHSAIKIKESNSSIRQLNRSKNSKMIEESRGSIARDSLNKKSPRILEIQIKNGPNPSMGQTQEMTINKEDQYKNRIESQQKGKSNGTNEGSGPTQIQNHSGSGSQQNLFIRNLFFIHNGNKDEQMKTQSSHNQNTDQDFPPQNQQYQISPVTAKNQGEHFNVQFDDKFQKHSNQTEPKQNQIYRPSSMSPTKQYLHIQDSRTKAIDIATSVLQQLVPLSKGEDDHQHQISGASVRMSVQTNRKSEPQFIEAQIKINKKAEQNNGHQNQIKKQESEKYEKIETMEFEGSLKQGLPLREEDKQGSLLEMQQLSMTGLHSKNKKPSNGEMPKYNKNCKDSGSTLIPNFDILSPSKPSIDPNLSQTKKQHTNKESQSRNQGEVFNYKMKTMNPSSLKNQIQSNPNTTKNALKTVQIDNSSELATQNERNNRSSSNQRQHHTISKSHSQHNFKVAKRSINLKEGQVSNTIHPSQEYMRNDAIYMSLSNLPLNQRQQSQVHDSENSRYKNESAYGEKQSDISCNLEKADKQCIKVVARFRPYNNIENEIQELYPNKTEIVIFNENDIKNVRLAEEFHTQSSNLSFTFDHIFKPHISQEEVFSIVGSSMIDDIMQGYNGTIFAYGQSGSGKTFTMYGDDIFDDSKMGIVPRAACQIFDYIRDQDLEVDYSIRIQMLEIYKENLRDLLHNTNERPPELKIKECPKRGTYVEGLQDVSIVNEEEFMNVICTGETMRHVASTQLNQVSSRSHSICMIEVISKYPNDSERRGVLNLCDLAGSERVSKSMAHGPALEEAKKINFSLSMLGKVIHCLTKNQPHIPYRDSKLTRLLKESLGGNNKTSLIVACSMHHSNFEETLSSLRFASSAKFIQNKVKLNIKTSNMKLHIIIEQLKIELRTAKQEIQKLRIGSQQNHSQIINKEYNQSVLSSKIGDNDSAYKPIVITQIQAPLMQANQSIIGNTPLQAIHNFPHQSLLAKNFDVIETNNQQSMQLITTFQSQQQDQTMLPMQTQSSNAYGSPSNLYVESIVSPIKKQNTFGDALEQQLFQKISLENEELEMKIKSKEQDIIAIQFQKDELQLKVNTLEEKVTGYKHRLLSLERKLQEQESQKDFMAGKEVTQSHKMRDYEIQIKSLNDQVSSLQNALEESQGRESQLSAEKLQVMKQKAKEVMEETFRVMKIQMTKQVEGLLQNQTNDEFEMLGNQQDQEVKSDSILQQQIYLKEKTMIRNNIYSSELNDHIMEGSIPTEVSIYLLKTQLIDVCLLNHNLQRYVSMTEWKLAQESLKLKTKEQQCKNQEETIGTLENILDRTRQNQDKLKSRLDKVEKQMNQRLLGQMNQGDQITWNDWQSNCDRTIGGDTLTHRATLTRRATTKNLDNFSKMVNHHNQSILSASEQNTTFGHAMFNTKSRFKRIVNSKTLQRNSRVDNSSPSSRISLRGGTLANQSIMSHYYGIKQNALQMMTGDAPTHKPQLSQIDSNTAGGSQSANTQDQVDEITHERKETEDFQRDDQIEDVYRDDNFLARSAGILSGQNNTLQLTAEDLKHIDASSTLQDVKDFLKAKMSFNSSGTIGNRIRALTMTTGKRASTSSLIKMTSLIGRLPRRKEQSRKDLYIVSELSEIKEDKDSPHILQTKPNLILENNESQELFLPKPDNFMMMTNNQENLNSPSAIGHRHNNFNLFTPRNAQAQQPQALLDQLASLHEQLALKRDEASMQRARGDEMKKLCQQQRKEIVAIKAQLDEKDVKFAEKLREESYEWEQAINQIKRLNEAELLRKQREIKKLNELLAKWIDGFQRQPKEMQNLVTESLNVQKSEVNNILLTEVMLSPTPQSRTMNQITFSNLQGEGQQNQKFNNNLSAMKSPTANREGHYYLQTPQSKGFSLQPVHTEHQNPSSKPGHHLTHSGGNLNAPLHSHASCASPSMNMLLTDRQDHQTFVGDNSPVHEEHQHSSFEDESVESTQPINMFNVSPDKDSIRVVKIRDQQLSMPSMIAVQMQQEGTAKRQSFVKAKSQDSSKIEWNGLNSHQDMSEVLSQSNNNINIQLAAINQSNNMLLGSVFEKQKLI